MRFQIRDALWIMLVTAVSLAWYVSSVRQAAYTHALERRVQSAEARATLEARLSEVAEQKSQAMAEQVRELRGIVKTSLADQRDWFELQVSGRHLVAIRPATTEPQKLTLQTIEQIEAETGSEASRLKHFMVPISGLRPNSK